MQYYTRVSVYCCKDKSFSSFRQYLKVAVLKKYQQMGIKKMAFKRRKERKKHINLPFQRNMLSLQNIGYSWLHGTPCRPYLPVFSLHLKSK